MVILKLTVPCSGTQERQEALKASMYCLQLMKVIFLPLGGFLDYPHLRVLTEMPEKPFASTLMRKARSILVKYIIMYHLDKEVLSAPRVLGAESSPDSSSVAADQVGLKMQETELESTISVFT